MASDSSSDALSLSPVELDRLTLAQWYESRSVSRATAFRLLKLARIEPHKVRTPTSRTPVSALDPEQVAALDALAAQLQAGATLPQLEAAAATALAVSSPSETVSDDPIPSASPFDPSAMQARLAATELAISTGAPLTTAEVSWLLGARPGAGQVQRGRLVATRQRRGVWTLHTEPPQIG